MPKAKPNIPMSGILMHPCRTPVGTESNPWENHADYPDRWEWQRIRTFVGWTRDASRAFDVAVINRATHGALPLPSHTVHLPLGALLTPCTMRGTGDQAEAHPGGEARGGLRRLEGLWLGHAQYTATPCT